MRKRSYFGQTFFKKAAKFSSRRCDFSIDLASERPPERPHVLPEVLDRPPQRPQASLGLRGRLLNIRGTPNLTAITNFPTKFFEKVVKFFFRFDDFFSFSSAVAGLSSYVQCWHFRLGQRSGGLLSVTATSMVSSEGSTFALNVRGSLNMTTMSKFSDKVFRKSCKIRRSFPAFDRAIFVSKASQLSSTTSETSDVSRESDVS